MSATSIGTVAPAPAARIPSPWPKRFADAGMRCFAIVLFIAIWAAVSLGNQYIWKAFNPILLPTPIDVVRAGIEAIQTGELQANIIASMRRVIQGFGIAAVAGVVVGLAVGTWKPLEKLVEPMIELLRPIPPLAFLPMMVLWFGIGEMSK
ncbi:MAG: binding-protein-dependent transport system inner rane component, partial [Belnapia sp.]|nr:binding-protein-dependent transport system inner rane component [Belnapia sp.]